MWKTLTLLSIMVVSSCNSDSKYYTLEDFDKVKKIDTHIHVSTSRDGHRGHHEMIPQSCR